MADRNSPQEHAWRAEIVLQTADGVGTNEIVRRTGKARTAVWRWPGRPGRQRTGCGWCQDHSPADRIGHECCPRCRSGVDMGSVP